MNADLLDDLRYSLQRHQDKAEDGDQLDRPAQQAAGVRGVLDHVEDCMKKGQLTRHDGAGRYQEDQVPEDVDPELARGGSEVM